MAKIQSNKEWNENTKTVKALQSITKRKGAKMGPKLYNEIPDREAVAKNSTTENRPLWIKSLFTSLRQTKLSIL
jgi:hypothetical protein